MNAIALAVPGGMVAGWITLALLRPVLGQPVFERTNHRGMRLPTAVGVVMPIALLGLEAVTRSVSLVGRGATDGADADRQLLLVLVTALALLGLVDDLAGSGEVRGFRGHLGALRNGRLTTGGLKLIGGGLAALIVCVPYASADRDAGGSVHLIHLLRDAALVALAANLGNLFDRAPGRVLKVSTVTLAVVGLLASHESAFVGPAMILGISLALLPGDLREQFMLGDTGANVLGGVVGFALVAGTSPGTRLVALVVVLLLNLASERVSFTRVIESIAPLRAFDRLGRPPSP